MSPGKPAPFRTHLRDLLEKKHLSHAEVARKADLDSTVFSRLVAADAGSARAPTFEHVLAVARALEMLPADLVAGTDAETVVRAWIPLEQYEREAADRLSAQAAHARAESEIAGLRAQLEAVSQQRTALERERDQAQQRGHRTEAQLAHARAAQEAAAQQRDAALDRASRAGTTVTMLNGQIAQLRAQVVASDSAAARNAGLGALGTIFGAVVGAAFATPGDDDELPPPSARQRTTRRRR